MVYFRKLKMKQDEAKKKSILKLTIKLERDPNDAMRSSSESNRLHCELYLFKTNVTPRSPINLFKFPEAKIKGNAAFNNRHYSISTVHWDYRNSVANYFLRSTVKSAHSLLNAIMTKRPCGSKERSIESKYDAGSNLYFPKVNISEKYEIELTESQTFIILDLPSSIVVKG